MATWNELFLNVDNVRLFPQTEIYKFIKKIEGIFNERPLKIWDQCCGGGRHSILISQMGHNVFSSDESENGLAYLKEWLKREKLIGEIKKCDMIINPWGNSLFHGTICWDAIHHNTIENIKKAIESIKNGLVGKGLFIATLMSTKSLGKNNGKEIEKNTFIMDKGADAGVPHHYFDQEEILKLFELWKPIVIAEQIVKYVKTEDEFWKTNPFPYTKWLILMEKI
jgi:SAM-dependent methyltransferase